MDFIIIVVFAVFTVIVLRKILCAFPGNYFSIQDIVTLNSNEINLFGFVLRFGLIFVFSLIIAFICNGSFKFLFSYSFFVSFLLIWPFVLEQIIYRHEISEKYFPSNKMTRKQIKHYLLVYFMYSIICILVSLTAIPVYNLIYQNPLILYEHLFEKYLLLDELQQSIFSNVISGLILALLIFIFRHILTKILKK